MRKCNTRLAHAPRRAEETHLQSGNAKSAANIMRTFSKTFACCQVRPNFFSSRRNCVAAHACQLFSCARERVSIRSEDRAAEQAPHQLCATCLWLRLWLKERFFSPPILLLLLFLTSLAMLLRLCLLLLRHGVKRPPRMVWSTRGVLPTDR